MASMIDGNDCRAVRFHLDMSILATIDAGALSDTPYAKVS